MSLIHDALKSMDAPQQQPMPAPTRPAAPVAAAGRGRPAWVDGLLAFCVVVGAGAAGWYVWQGQKPTLDPAPSATRAASPRPQALPAPAVADPLPLPVAVHPPADAAAVTPAAPTQVASTTPTAVHAAPESHPSAAPVQGGKSSTPEAEHATPPAKHAVVHRRSRPDKRVEEAQKALEPKADDTPVEVHFARFVTAMRAENTADAERELGALKARLPATALGLLRAQAWFDLKTGNDAAAAGGYRAILDRMPGDEEAAINLASIQSRQNKPEEARSTLDAAARLRPDSAALKTALAQYTPNAHK